MKIDLYARCWNEEDMLPFFFMHYDNLVQRYIIYDDESTDSSRELMHRNPKVEVRPTPPYGDPDSRIASALALQESCWKESRGVADWVIVTDIDEHLYHPQIDLYLAKCREQGVTIIPALGYNMISEQFPGFERPLCRSVTKGVPAPLYSKLNVFSPDAIEAVNYRPGRHSAAPTGVVIAPAREELLLLHYHYLGFERVQKRYARFAKRQRKRDVAMGWGFQYSWTPEQLRQEWDEMARHVVDISQPDLRPWATHLGPRWWHWSQRAAVKTHPHRASPSKVTYSVQGHMQSRDVVNKQTSKVSPDDFKALLDDFDGRKVIIQAVVSIVEQVLFGRKPQGDSYDVDNIRVKFLAACVASCQYAEQHMVNARRATSDAELLKFAIENITIDGLVLEFGVSGGRTINHIAGLLPHKKVYGFDSFQGLPEKWRSGFEKGMFARSDLPSVRENVELVVGWFDRTLPTFCDGHRDEKAALLHIDCVLYSSTQAILQNMRDHIVPGTIIVFDEYFNYPGWQHHEFGAFKEFVTENKLQYEYIGLVPHWQQVAVRIIG